jgi:hypothetical protein
MADADPHIHVDVKLHADVAVRDVTAATFSLAADLPSHARTGCGTEVPYMMTSARPDSVTCLSCRQFAHRRYLELAGSAETFGNQPVFSGVDLREQAKLAAVEYRELASRFA